MARVLIIGDTHCPAMRTGYVEFLKRVERKYNTDRTVHIGDLVDWASISYHEKHPVLRNPTLEYGRAKRQVAKLAKAFPKADWLIGNHDALTERQLVTAGLPPELLRSYGDMWEVPWTVHPRFATLEIDGVFYRHGDAGRGGMDAASRQAQDNFRSTVIGHFHGQAGVKWFANADSRVFGLSVGCGVDASALAMDYGKRFSRKPLLGCGVVIGGKQAYFEPWLLSCK
ncbi:Calcineurin-like phosphoesterase domain, ApaH type [uncultured Caudovirales phage]|uniref:Calcineurin-like phosphoesterase domain, ApaH type n=1 Tax=uncultured Caudovirales phage TaxID=2100421 RepID=A0A6J5Q0K9_9CAUD|nr:Calcineurin-like phosphoesterase domain, ApaH type [uncultured Caudovirales phage]